MMKGGTCQHEPIKQRYRDAHVNALRKRTQHAARLRAVNEQLVFDARITRGNHERPAVNRKANVTNEAFVENLIDEIPIIDCPLGKTLERRAFGWLKSFHSCRD